MDFQTGSHGPVDCSVACREVGSLGLLVSMGHTYGQVWAPAAAKVRSLALSLSCDLVSQSAWVELQELGGFLAIKFLGQCLVHAQGSVARSS